jgi:hypothetical protein
MDKDDHNPLNRSPYCGDPGALVSYLYNDGSADELAAIAAHVHECDACSRELALLGDTRDVLSAWSPPPAELGFTLSASDVGAIPAALTSPGLASPAISVRDSAPSLPWWRQSTPVWMQAVAATVVFGAGLAIGTSGRNVEPATPSADTAAAAAAAATRSELSALEQSLRTELARLASARASAPAPVQAAAPLDDEAVMRRVRTLVSDSEERQRQELALRTTQVLRDIEIQRKVDMATVQQNLSQIQGMTGAELQRNRELYNQLMNNASLRGGAR